MWEPLSARELEAFIRTAGDISERLAAEERAHLHQTQLAHFSRLNTIGEMASGIAHELNQPLAAIVNYTRGCLRRLPSTPTGEAGIDALHAELRWALEAAASQAERMVAGAFTEDYVEAMKAFTERRPPRFQGR